MSTSQSCCSGVLSTPRFVARTGIGAMIGEAGECAAGGEEALREADETCPRLAAEAGGNLALSELGAALGLQACRP